MQNTDTNRKASAARSNSIVGAAVLIGLGNIASRILGLGRVSVIAALFGRTTATDAYLAAWTVPSTLYDMLINGAVSAALVPVFSEYADNDEQEFWRIVSGVITLVLLLLCVLVGLLVWQAPLVASLLVRESEPELRALTAQMVRLLLPAVLFMGLSALMTAVLYARRTFLLPAFAGATFNAGVIVGAVLLHEQFGIASLAVGTVIGGVGQVLLQVWGLRDMRYRPRLNLRHPALSRIGLLYAPVALGIGFSIIGMVIDRRLASGFDKAVTTMQNATTLIQFPLGLIAAAVSLAVLPTLSRQSTANDEHGFRQTLGMGLKVVMLLVIPATAGLAALATPITALLLQRGEFGVQDTAATAQTLLFYLPGLPAAAIDQVLLFAFYARQNTLMPNLVQGAAIVIYLVTALLLLTLTQLGFLALVLGNSAQWIGHALILAVLLSRAVSLRGLRLSEAFGKIVLASGLMALVVFGIANSLQAISTMALLGSPLVQIIVAGGLGGLLYLGLCLLFRVEALGFFVEAVATRFRGKRA